jgi:hypothetical protein
MATEVREVATEHPPAVRSGIVQQQHKQQQQQQQQQHGGSFSCDAPSGWKLVSSDGKP